MSYQPQWGQQPPQQYWGPPPQQPPPPPQPPKGPLAIIGAIALMCVVCGIIGALAPKPPQNASSTSISAPANTAPRVGVPPVVAPSPSIAAQGDAGAVARANDGDAGASSGNSADRSTITEAQAKVAEVYTDVVRYDDELAALEERVRAITDPSLRRDTRTALSALGRRRRSIRSEATRARRDAAERAALSIVCGDTPPAISGWDGELAGSESYLRRTAHDPGSIDVENCTQPILTRRACWVSRCQVRGRNAFGAMVLNTVTFSVGRNGILGAE